MSLRPYQQKAIEGIRANYAAGNKKCLLWLATGSGKCHGRGTPILMFDGSVKNVELVENGDLLMGPDSKPRTVLSLAKGIDELYKINPIKGEPWVCNKAHILSLVDTESGEIINISVEDYLKKNKYFKHRKKQYRTGVVFPKKNISFDPYMVGIYLAEGSTHNPQITNPDKEILQYCKGWADNNGLIIRDKEGRGCREYHFLSKKQGWFTNQCDKLRKFCTEKGSRWIPKEYLTNSRQIRLNLLAGLLDGDGYLNRNGYQIITKYKKLSEDILYLARSLGLAAYCSEKKGVIKSVNFVGWYFSISISGNTSEIPCLVERKKSTHRKQKKNVLRTGFKIENIGQGDYFGFEIDGDNRYLLGDFTVTHNTVVFCHILKGIYEKGNRGMIVVRGKHLVTQASERLDREGVPHGVLMAGHWRNRPESKIFVCSIDTLYARRNKGALPEADLLIIDEAHMATSPSYMWLVQQYPSAYFLPVTATPFVKKGLKHVANAFVNPIKMLDLIEQGYLVPPEYYAPSKPSLEHVHIDRKTGDYKLDELSEVMRKSSLYGNMVSASQKYAKGLPTIIFCVDVEHSKAVCEVFNKAGITAEHIDAKSKDSVRREIISRFESRETQVITNVGILTTGVDIPCVECIILARPTKSYNLYIQILGRGTRPFPGKEKFIVLDHADCIAEHGFITSERKFDLEEIAETYDKLQLVTCLDCYHMFDPVKQWEKYHKEEAAEGRTGRDYVCDAMLEGVECGCDNTPVMNTGGGGGERKTDVYEDIELKKIDTATLLDAEMASMKMKIRGLVHKALTRGYASPAGWVYHQLKEDKRHRALAGSSFKFIQKVLKEYGA